MSTNDWITVLAVVTTILATSLIATIGWIVRKLMVHDSALAVLIAAVNPPGDKSLRDLLYELKIQVAERR
ncbi:MAG: hypothetical protein ACREHG_01810 [Candidatus Saccharimonadales bacterium]